MDPVGFFWVIEEIEALSNIRELNFRHFFPRVREGKLILTKRGTVSPHSSKYEESFIDCFDFIFLFFFSMLLHHLLKNLISFKIIVEMVNDAAKSCNLTDFYNWSNMIFVLKIFQEGVIDILFKGKRENIISMLILVSTILVFVQPFIEV